MAGWPTDAAIERAATALRDMLGVDDQPHDEVAKELLEAAGLPELVGSSQAAAMLGVATGNLGKIADLPEPLYSPDEGGPSGGRLYEAEAIRKLARERLGRRATEIAAEDKPILDRLSGKPE